MYEGDNKVALQSIEYLKDALVSLMKEKTYSQITIKDICEKAKLSRQTFYNYFDEKDDILYFCIKKCFSDNWTGTYKFEETDIEQASKVLSQIFEDNMELFQLVSEQNLEHILSKVISDSLQIRISKWKEQSDSKFNAYYAAYSSGALTNLLIYWLKDTDRITTKEFASVLYKMRHGR